MRSGNSVATGRPSANYNGLTCGNSVSEGGLEPPCPFGALAPQASASAYSATRTWGSGMLPGRPHDSKSGHLPATRPSADRAARGRGCGSKDGQKVQR